MDAFPGKAAVLMIGLLLGPSPGAQQTDTGQEIEPALLEARLAETTGRLARRDLLVALADAYQRKQPAKAIAFGEEALEILAAMPDAGRRLALLIALSRAHLNLRDTRPGLQRAQQAAALAREVGDDSSRAHAVYLIGRNYWRAEAPQRALEALAEASDLYGELGDRFGQGKALIYAGYVYRDLDDFENALRVFLSAHRLFEETGDLRWIGIALNNIGIVYHSLGQSDDALAFYQRALAIQEERGDRDQIGRLLQNIGSVYKDLDQPRLALDTHLRALEILEAVGHPDSIANTTINVGTDYRALGDLDRAMTYFERALEISEELGDKVLIARATLEIGAVQGLSGRHETARQTLEGVAAAAGPLLAEQRSRALKELAEIYAAEGRDREALDAFRQYHGLQIEKRGEENRRHIAEMQARFESEQRENEIELLRRQQALSGLELERQRDARQALVVGFSLVLLILALAFNRFRLKSRQALMVETVRQERAVSRRLRAIDKLKDEFLANTSHELRTPLYGMTGLAESLADGARGELTEAVRSDLALLVASGRRLTVLVNDILDYSKLRNASLEVDRRPIDLRVLAEVVLTLSRPLVGSKDLELRNAVPADLPAADADENRLQQILHNLVANAVKFTASGEVEVSARKKQQEERLSVTVRDTGIGIPPDRQKRIFEAFAQADASTEREFGGTGLGLTITRQLVELHGGTLTVESAPGKGSTFTFDLPVAEGAPTAPPTFESPIARVTRFEPVAVEIPPRRVESGSEEEADLLVVDDEAIVLRILSNQLATHGYRVTATTSGAEALQLAGQRSFDMVILDVMMPRMSGYEVCRTLRLRHPLEQLPVLFLTAKNQVEDLVAGLAAGANDYLPKPVSKSELLARVQIHLDLLSVHRQLSRLVAERTAEVSEREKLLSERQRLIGELETRNAELARFNYAVAHDLKNPLVTIHNFLGLLRRETASGRMEHLEHLLDRLDSAATRMQRLLEELFEFSRVGHSPDSPELVALGELMSEALEELSGPVAEKGVRVEVADDLPVVYGDRAGLREVARHLLTNAVKYLDGDAGRVEVGTRKEGSESVIFVRDNGRGIDPRYHEKVFGLFERLDPDASQGTGIGLALVKRVLDAHGGRIWVESGGRGLGSTFYFTLPQCPPTRDVPAGKLAGSSARAGE